MTDTFPDYGCMVPFDGDLLWVTEGSPEDPKAITHSTVEAALDYFAAWKTGLIAPVIADQDQGSYRFSRTDWTTWECQDKDVVRHGIFDTLDAAISWPLTGGIGIIRAIARPADAAEVGLWSMYSTALGEGFNVIAAGHTKAEAIASALAAHDQHVAEYLELAGVSEYLGTDAHDPVLKGENDDSAFCVRCALTRRVFKDELENKLIRISANALKISDEG